MDDLRIYISIESRSKDKQLVVDGPLELWRELLLSMNLQRIEMVPNEEDPPAATGVDR